jgi:hypothetical protein|nr:FecR domain-containing protein [Kofleriaceae bacterium]
MTRRAMQVWLTADDSLDAIRSARVWARLDARLAREGDGAVAGVPAMRARARRFAIAGVAAAVAIAAVAALVVGSGRGAPTADIAMVAPPGGVMATTLGPYARATVVGPAQLAIAADAGSATTVHMTAGAVFAEFDGGRGRSLRIETPHAVVTIVGTRFSVEATATATCVAVAHGRVRVDTPTGTTLIDGGSRWCSDHATAPLAPSERARLDQFLPPPVAASEPVVVPLAAAAPAPPPADLVAPIVAPAAVPAPPAATAASASAITTAPAPAHPVTAAAAAPPPPPSAEQLYERADTALAHDDAATADRLLATVVTTAPASPLADQALYERARLAFARHDWPAALARLDELAARTASPLAEPALYLRCRVALESPGHAGDAAACLAGYRRAFPAGPHDADALGHLAELAFAAGGCDAARALTRELARSHATSDVARAWLARCPEAPP